MSDATSVDPTAVLFGLEEEFSDLEVQRIDQTTVKVIIEQTAREGPCPACGVLTSVIKERPLRRLKDLPACGQTVELWWRKRRLVCRERQCRQKSFTQVGAAARPGHRATTAAGSARDRGEQPRSVGCGREYQVSWPTAHKALVSAAAAWLPEPEPTTRLGIDETRFRSVRWILDGITWRRSDPWLTSFVDCSRDGPGSLLALAPGRTGACVREWLGEQTSAFRKRIVLANQMVTEVRQRVTRDQLGRRGTSRDPIWVNRRLLLTGVEHLSRKQADRLWRSFDTSDPTEEIQAAWAV